MHKIIKIFLLIIFLTFLSFINAYAFDNESSVKPNVILIVADDMGVGDISAFNGGLSETPILDKLIGEGIYFNQAYAGSSVCAPSRAALLTGRYPHRTGSVTLNQRNFPDLTRIKKNEILVSDIFKYNGYVTGLIGKWHSGIGVGYHPLERGFHEFIGFSAGSDISNYVDFQLDIQGEYKSVVGEYLTDLFNREAIKFVRKHKNNPFFLHLAHYAPHRPLSAPNEVIKKYLNRGFDENTATIYAMIEIMDRGIGDLVYELDELGIRDNTIIIFTSDNGPDPLVGERFNLNHRGAKYYIYEGGIHVPFFINWQNNIQPSKRDEVIHFTDLLPSLIEICDLEVPDSLRILDGGSFYGLLYEKSLNVRLPDHRFWQWNRGVPYYSHNAAIREGDWKLIKPFVTMRIPDSESNALPKLFNLADDPSETIDLSEEYPERYDRMRVLLRQWSREMEWDRMNIEN